MNREQSQEEFEGQLKEKQLQEGQITEDTEKSKQENKITEGVIWKQLLLFFFPILFGTFFQQLYNAADAVIVGQFVGKEALSAVGGTTGTVINLLVGFFIGLGSGATVVISQYYGAKREEMVSFAVHTAIAFSLAAGLILMLIGLPLAPAILRSMSTPEDVLDLLFVVCFKMGVAGAALATILSQLLSAVLVIIVLMRTKDMYHLELKKIGFDKRMFRRIIRIGFPAGLQSVMYSLSNLIIQVAINKEGTDTVAAWTVYGKIDVMFWMVINAFGISVTTFVGQNFGAEKLDRVKKGIRTCLGLSLVATVLISTFLYVGCGVIFSFFTKDAAVIEIGVQIARFLVPLYVTYICVEIMSGSLRGVGDVWIPTLICLSGICLIRVIWIMTAVPVWPGIRTIIFSYPLTWTVTSILFILYYLFFSKIKKKAAGR